MAFCEAISFSRLIGGIGGEGGGMSHPVFKAKTRCSLYVFPGSSCHTYGQNVSTEYQCFYYIVS
jgi:hypothetical protein